MGDFIKAVDAGDDAAVRRFLEEGGADANAVDQGWPAIVGAAQGGHTATVGVLIEHTADLEAKNPDGLTALIMTGQNGHADTARVLAEAGANLEAKNAEGYTPIIWAGEMGHADTARVLAEAGANLEAKKPNGFNALLAAAQNGHDKTAQVLIEHKADLEAKDRAGRTALILAALMGHTECIRVLLNANAAVDAQDNTGRTALWQATLAGHAAAAELLIQRKASVDLPSGPKDRGWIAGQEEMHDTTPLHQAVENGHLAIAQALLCGGADPSRACNGMPLLALACRKEKFQAPMAELLIRSGSDADVFPPIDNEFNITHAATGKPIKLKQWPRCVYLAMQAIGRHGEAMKLRARTLLHPSAARCRLPATLPAAAIHLE